MNKFAHRDTTCYETTIEMADVMDDASAGMISNLAEANALPPGYMVPLLLATCAHHLNASKIKASETWIEPSVIFAAIIGYPGTNKSRAIAIFRTAIRAVEDSRGIGKRNTRINEGICKHYPLDGNNIIFKLIVRFHLNAIHNLPNVPLIIVLVYLF